QGLFNSDEIESFAIGDLNHDGRPDIYAGYAQIYTTPSNIPDAVWLNTTATDNHFLSVSLIGTASNRNGIGARITIYGSWGQQIREVRSGESYGIMNSFSQNFGLGSATTVESIVVKWPSGQVDTYTNLAADQFITLIEGTCISPDVAIAADGPLTFCTGESITISAPEGFATYTWSNGSTGTEIEVTASGAYSVVVDEGNGCFSSSLPIVVTVDPIETPSISALGDTLFCQGGSVELVSSEATAYTWSTGATTPSILVTETGDYSVTTQGLCAEFSSSPLYIEVLAAPAPEVTPDTVIISGDAVLYATGDNPQWYDAPVGGNLVTEGDSLLIPSLAATTTFYVEDAELYPGPVYLAGIPEHAGNTSYNGGTVNGQIIFNAYKAFTLKTVKVSTDTPAERTIELKDDNGTVLQSLDVQIDSGEYIIILDFEVPVANGLTLGTNTQKNVTELGTNSPRLRRTNGPVNYPYEVPEVLSITGSNQSPEVYYYFYKWQIKLPDAECTSERVPVEAVLFVPNSTDETGRAGSLTVYPNPASGEVFVTLPELSASASLRVFDLNGAALVKQMVTPGQLQATLQVRQLPAGVYAVKVEDAGKTWVGRLVVAR
ncbi:MAG: ASPIC/UnbV domain-containing protein, partial [Saprospiraceae bacterium]